jgi:hypothetical protein
LGLGRKPEDEVHRVARLLALAVAKPRQSLTNGAGGCADLLGLCLYQVNVFGVSERLLEEQFMHGGAAAKRNLARQCWRIEQVAQGAADN